jgi:hypothetical protein
LHGVSVVPELRGLEHHNMKRALILLLVWGLADHAHASDCVALVNGKYADARITTAEPVARGGFSPKDESGAPATIFRELPAFCRVVGVIRPTSDSQVGFELWLPDQWNGRYLQTGNGGFAGLINFDNDLGCPPHGARDDRDLRRR